MITVDTRKFRISHSLKNAVFQIKSALHLTHKPHSFKDYIMPYQNIGSADLYCLTLLNNHIFSDPTKCEVFRFLQYIKRSKYSPLLFIQSCILYRSFSKVFLILLFFGISLTIFVTGLIKGFFIFMID